MKILNNLINVNFEVFKIFKKENIGDLEILLYKNKKNEGIVLIKSNKIIINYTRSNEIEKEYLRLKKIYSKN
jgi:hypothetical protein